MINTLVKSSNIVVLKSKFFLSRAVTYAAFLLIPILAPKSLEMNAVTQSLMMLLYIGFMASQWFFLGKEIDHRFKIYFRTNSSIDRVLYRLILGMSVITVYFNVLNLFPGKWVYNFFWITWVVLGLFYSWPTRGKIIQESVTSNFSEFKYLDSFEKTLLALIVLMFVVSLPELPTLTNQEALKLFFDPLQRFASQWWNFLEVNYYPFKKYPQLFKLAWSMHFFVVGMGLFLVTLYALLRYFVSRRLSLLGVFALVSSWSFSKILANNYGDAIFATFTLMWVWALIWSAKASSYRIGLAVGLLGFYGTMINQSNIILIFAQFVLGYHLILKGKTKWFKLKWIRYNMVGLIFALFCLFTNWDSTRIALQFDLSGVESLFSVLGRKGFYMLAPFGLLMIGIKLYLKPARLSSIVLDKQYLLQVGVLTLSLFVGSIFISPHYLKNFGWMWGVVLLSLIPLEFIFQATFRLRSRRNIIYLSYILICLLDSHFEGRLKIFLKLFE